MVRCTPQYSDLVAKSSTTSGHLDICQPLGQTDLWSDVPSIDEACTKCQPDPPQAETSYGQTCDYFGHIDLWSDVPL